MDQRELEGVLELLKAIDDLLLLELLNLRELLRRFAAAQVNLFHLVLEIEILRIRLIAPKGDARDLRVLEAAGDILRDDGRGIRRALLERGLSAVLRGLALEEVHAGLS